MTPKDPLRINARDLKIGRGYFHIFLSERYCMPFLGGKIAKNEMRHMKSNVLCDYLYFLLLSSSND